VIRAAHDKAFVPGKTPLDVMLRNMRYYDDKAEKAMRWVESRMEDSKTKAPEVLALLQEMSEYRMKAQKCACEAAPFVHPKLANIQHNVTTDKVKAKPEDQMSPEELDDYYNQLRMRPTTHVPLIIDNNTGDEFDVHEDADVVAVTD
jgi:hypothetical protein